MGKKKRVFGTDGIRGRANVGMMTPDNIMRLGMAAGKYFHSDTSHSALTVRQRAVYSGGVESLTIRREKVA